MLSLSLLLFTLGIDFRKFIECVVNSESLISFIYLGLTILFILFFFFIL